MSRVARISRMHQKIVWIATAEDDPHNGRFQDDCASCHNPVDWLQWQFDSRPADAIPAGRRAHQCQLRKVAIASRLPRCRAWAAAAATVIAPMIFTTESSVRIAGVAILRKISVT